MALPDDQRPEEYQALKAWIEERMRLPLRGGACRVGDRCAAILALRMRGRSSLWTRGTAHRRGSELTQSATSRPSTGECPMFAFGLSNVGGCLERSVRVSAAAHRSAWNDGDARGGTAATVVAGIVRPVRQGASASRDRAAA